MRRKTVYALILALVSATAGMPANASEASAPPPPRKTRPSTAETIRSVAEIVALDAKTRAITFKRDDGNTLQVIAATTVRNFSHLRVGDFVVAEYGRARAVSLKQVTASELSPATAKPTPTSNVRSIVADIIAIDDKKGQATLKAAHGQIVDVTVKDRRMLGAVKIGDHVRLDYHEAVAYSVKPARSKRKPKGG